MATAYRHMINISYLFRHVGNESTPFFFEIREAVEEIKSAIFLDVILGQSVMSFFGHKASKYKYEYDLITLLGNVP